MTNGSKQMVPEDESVAQNAQVDNCNPQLVSIQNFPEHVTFTQHILRNNVCRICATYYESGPQLVPLFKCYAATGRPLADMVNALLPITVRRRDGLPKVACITCVRKVEDWRAVLDRCMAVREFFAARAAMPEMHENPNYNGINESLAETLESVLASYSLNISSMKLVCQKCDLKTSSEEFSQHLFSKHGDVREKDAVEAFVRDHVTFEETLDSDSDGDRMSASSSASTGTCEAPPCLECPLCSTVFSTRSRLYHHLTKHDVNIDSIPCCGVSRNKTELVKHLRTDHTTNPLRCKSCSHVAADTAVLATHIAHCRTGTTSTVPSPAPQLKEETNQKLIPAVCPDCNRAFSNKYNMLNHFKSHGKTNEKFHCKCGKSYTTRGNLEAHKRIAHSGQLPHSCIECGEGFSSRSARDIHSRLHTGSRPFSCSLCSRAFRAKNSLDKHAETHGPRQHECELCGKKFRRKAHLRYHVGTHRRRPT